MPEALLLRDHLVEALAWPAGDVVVEAQSSSTWENVANVLPILQRLREHGALDWVAIASNGLHAEKARRYLRRQSPLLEQLLVPASDYRFGEMFWIKPVFAVVGLVKLRSARRSH